MVKPQDIQSLERLKQVDEALQIAEGLMRTAAADIKAVGSKELFNIWEAYDVRLRRLKKELAGDRESRGGRG